MVFILLVSIALAPGLYWRGEATPRSHPQQLGVSDIAVPADLRRLGDDPAAPVLDRAWQLSSDNELFSGFSALVALDSAQFLAVTDGSHYVRWRLADGQLVLEGGRQLPAAAKDFKYARDIESITRDPDTGQLWFGLEMRNAIRRTDADFDALVQVSPEPMAIWPSNSGPESLLRLSDGRFLTISEGARLSDTGGYAALQFGSDPIRNPPMTAFGIRPPDNYQVTDMAEIPDGRVLILLRRVKLNFPPRFQSRILIADPATIAEGENWQWEELARLEDPRLPLDNFEGLAVTEGDDGKLDLWVISDDNAMKFQRTILLKITWNPGD